jgi:putative membrane protein
MVKKYIVLFFLGLVLSAVQPKEYFTWFLEVIPALVGFIILVFTYKKFQFTNYTYLFILIHCIILFIGGHYTYAEVPLFDWIKEAFD